MKNLNGIFFIFEQVVGDGGQCLGRKEIVSGNIDIKQGKNNEYTAGVEDFGFPSLEVDKMEKLAYIKDERY